MRFLEQNELWDWCRDHGVALTNDSADAKDLIGLGVDPSLTLVDRLVYANGRRSGREGAVAASVVSELGRWDECIVRVTGWGIWPSGEDWPRFYGWRGARGERRSLDKAPGHLFSREEEAEFEAFLGMVLEFAWDATILVALNGQLVPMRVVVSHDEFIERWERSTAATPPASV